MALRTESRLRRPRHSTLMFYRGERSVCTSIDMFVIQILQHKIVCLVRIFDREYDLVRDEPVRFHTVLHSDLPERRAILL